MAHARSGSGIGIDEGGAAPSGPAGAAAGTGAAAPSARVAPGAPAPGAGRFGASESVARQVVDLVVARFAAGRPVRVLGLTGPPGTGKSTVATLVSDLLEARGIDIAGLVAMDGFHLSNAILEDLGRADRKGAPDTFDVWGYVSVLERIRRADRVVYAPGYRRDLHEPIAAMSRVAPVGLVVTEGNYLAVDRAGWREARKLVDLLVYLDTDREELLRRLVARQEAFGRDHVDAAHWVRTVDAANIDLVGAGRDTADAVVTA